MYDVIHPVILCGGSGTRLWPLSRQQFPKQFVPLIEGKSLLSLSAQRIESLSKHITLVTGQAHRFLARDALEQVGLHPRLILEPAGRNTAPAMALLPWMHKLHTPVKIPCCSLYPLITLSPMRKPFVRRSWQA